MDEALIESGDGSGYGYGSYELGKQAEREECEQENKKETEK